MVERSASRQDIGVGTGPGAVIGWCCLNRRGGCEPRAFVALETKTAMRRPLLSPL